MRALTVPSSLRLNIPSDGAAGTRETLKHMRKLVQQGLCDVNVRDLANRIVRRVPGKDWFGEFAALLDWVRGNVRYSLDPDGVETIQDAQTTIRLGYGDCDDFAVLVATFCGCLGHPAALIAIGCDAPGQYSHVLTIASGAGETPWVAIDATEAHPLGWFPAGVTCELIAPISETAEYLLQR